MTAALAARGSDAELAATRQLALIVRKQAEVMAISDVFLALTVVFLGCVGLAAADAPPGAGGSRGRRRPLSERTRPPDAWERASCRSPSKSASSRV